MGAAAAISTGVSAVGNIIAGNKAAKAQKQAAAVQAKQFKETKAALQPYMDTGTEALDTYKTGIGLNGADRQREYYQNFQNDPGWQASVDYGLRGVENSNAIRGRGYGGNVMAGVGDYLQKNMLGAYQTRQSQLGGLVDKGQSSALGLGQIGQASAAGQASSLANAGYYQGAGIANAGNSLMQGYGNSQQQQAYGQGLSGAGMQGGGNFLGNMFS